MRRIWTIYFLFQALLVQSQQITQVEYFMDSDPGVGLAQQLPIGSNSIIDTTFIFSIDTLTTGLHTLYIRAKDDSLRWGLAQKHLFFKSEGIAIPQVEEMEYFFDYDPGYGAAYPIVIDSPAEVLSIPLNLVIDTLSTGLHILFVRAKANNGFWSLTQKHTFFKLSGGFNPEVVAVEYFTDTDPGYGNATPLSVGANAEIDTTFTLDLSGFPTGLHTLYIRSLSDNGFWSLVQKHTFFVTQGMTGLKEITKLEYFWDIDPGYGNGIQIDYSAEPMPHDQLDFAFNVSMSGLDVGMHKLHIRAMDEAGYWSLIHTEEVDNELSDGLFPELVLSRDTIEFSTADCNSVYSDTLLIRNNGQNVLNFAISESLPWLNISPTNNSIAAGDFIVLTAEINPIGLPAGIHSGFVSVLSNDPNNEIDSIYFEMTLNGQPLLSFSDSLIDFGQIQLTTTSDYPISILNLGCADLIIDSISVSNPVFSIPIITDSTLVSGNSIQFDVDFAPLAAISYNEVLRIYSNNAVDTIQLQGSGLAVPDIDIQPTLLSFTTDQCDSIHQETITINNLGNGELIWQLDNPLPSWLSLPETSGTIASSMLSELVTTFSSIALNNGTYSHDLIITSNDPASPQVIIATELIVDGLAEMTIDSMSLNAGEALLGENDFVFSFINNTGCDTLVIDTVMFQTNNFSLFEFISLNTPFPFLLEPGSFFPYYLLVEFTPDSIGVFNDTISIVSNVGTQFIPITGIGIGVPLLYLSQEQIDTSFSVCDDTALIPVTIKNTGTSNLITQIASGNFPSWLSVSSSLDTISAGDSIFVQFLINTQGLANGIYNHNATLFSNDPNQEVVSFPVSFSMNGTSTFSIPNTSLDFGFVGMGMSEQLFITLQNDGCDSIYLNNLLFDNPAFSSAAAVPILVMPYASVSIPIDFMPTILGGVTGAVVIETDAGNQSVNLLGISCPASLIISQVDTTICSGDILTLSTNLTDNITWPNGQTTSTIEINQAGSFTATYIDSYDCSLTSNTVTIDTFPDAYIETIGFSTVCVGDQATLVGHNATVFNWSTGEGTDTISVSPTDTTTYVLMAENAAGCVYVDSVAIGVIPAEVPGVVGNMLPVDGSVDLDLPVTLSWFPAPNATHYDVFIWEQGTTPSTTPAIANNTQITASYSLLDYGNTYEWRIESKNSCLETISSTQTFSIRHLPDLLIPSVIGPATASSEQEITVDWTVLNQGLGNTIESWVDHIYISTDEILDGSDLALGTFSNFSALQANESYTQMSIPVTIPQGLDGNFFILIYSSGILEDSLSNNLSTFPIHIDLAPPPDLQVNSVIVSPNNQFSGHDISVEWEVSNFGIGPTIVSNWTDIIYLSSEPVLNINNAIFFGQYNHSGILNKDSSYTQIVTLTLPITFSGEYYVHIVTDAFDNVFEATQSNNNTGVSNILNVILAPAPDLVVSNISIPTEASNNQSVTFSWTLGNAGGTATSNNWEDGIYLSLDSTDYTLINAIQIGTQTQSNTIQAGASQGISKSFNLPNLLTAGNYYIYVKADNNNEVFEHLNENNNVSRSNSSISITNVDLIVSSVTVPETGQSGEHIAISWTLKNQGEGSIFNAAWTDQILISSHSIYHPDSVSVLEEYSNTGLVLLAGDSIVRQTTVPLPEGISGTYYLYVYTDFNNQIFENTDENNNTNASSININLSDWVDLAPLNLIVPDTVYAGNLAEFSFELTNIGLVDLENGSWKDELYISQNPIYDPSSSLVGHLNRNQSLAISELITSDTSLIIPANLPSGTYYIHVIADAENAIFEHTGEGNNILSSGMLELIAYPPVDLEVIAAETVNTLAFSGTPIEISWQVQNSSIISTITAHWEDVLYLSLDMILDGSDILVESWEETGQLNSNDNYTKTENPILPNGVSGVYYLILSADHTQMHNDADLSNNVKVLTDNSNDPVLLDIQLTPPSDLIITSTSLPNQGIAGQPIDITFNVENQAVGITTVGNWRDACYLSTDFQIDNNDVRLEIFDRTENLDANASYEVTAQVFIPTTASGNYIIIIKTDDGDVQYEHNAENNNESYSNIFITQPPPSDLTVSQVVTPLMKFAGESATINWVLANDGINPAIGYLKEVIYLSPDTIWDGADILFGVKEGTINLPSGDTQNRNFTALLTGVSVENYHAIIRTDILNNIIEINDDNNAKVSETTLEISVPELPLETLTSNNLSNAVELYYRIEIPDSLAGETLSIELIENEAISAANELYVRYGQVPSRSVHDFSFPNPFAASQQIIVPDIQAGTYYIMAYGTSPSADPQSIDLYAEILDFDILSVQANQGGNTGTITVQITGSKFEENMTASLQNDTLGTITAQTIYYTNSTALFATFNLTGTTEGIYDVVLEKLNGDTTALDGGFEIVEGSPSASGAGNGSDGFVCEITNIGYDNIFDTDVDHPASTRPNRVVSITIYFANEGNVDIPVPTRFIVSLAGSPIGFSVNDFPEDFQELLLEFEEIGGPPGILRPGGSGSIILYSKAGRDDLRFAIVE